MLLKIIIGLAAVIAIFAIIVALQPSTYRIERSTAIAAQPADIFPHLNELRKAHVWSPWVKVDPDAKFTFDGPAAGVGASTSWAGNKDIGEGRQTIIESRPYELVRSRLDFEKPFKSTATTEFSLQPEARQTMVTWRLHGKNKFFCKAICLFMNQDKMVGDQFEKGLAELKSTVEAPVLMTKK